MRYAIDFVVFARRLLGVVQLFEDKRVQFCCHDRVRHVLILALVRKSKLDGPLLG